MYTNLDRKQNFNVVEREMCIHTTKQLRLVLWGNEKLIVLVGPPGGGEWIISVGDYVDNAFTALGVATPGKLGSSSS